MACCPPGSYGALKTDPSNCSGEVLQVGDLPVYLTGKGKEEKPSSAMVVFYDIFGFQGHSRIREICDFLAENTGLRVYMADYYHGEQWDSNAPLDGSTFAWVKTFPWEERVKKDHLKLLEYLKEQGITQYGGIGFCWGCWALFKAASVDAVPKMVCGVNCHPSLQLEEKLFEASIVELAKTVKVDQLILPASNDIPEVKEGGDVIKALRENGAKCEVHEYEKRQHGFVPRGDISDPEVKADVVDALERSAKYFNEKL